VNKLVLLNFFSLLRILFLVGSFASLAHAESVNSCLVRVAVLRDVSSVQQAIKSLCRYEYSGSVRVVKDSSGKFLAVNTLNVEEFLLGAVACEMSPKGPLEALKAQAIAARSHALYMASTSANQSYDLIANLSQAYKGKTKLHKNVVLAIESTRGQLLYFNDKLFPSYYHDSCGGHTTSAAQVWPRINSGQFPSRMPWPTTTTCSHCEKSQENKWTFEISRGSLKRSLEGAGYKVGLLPSVRVIDKDEGGHIKNVSIDSDLKSIVCNAESLRALLGYSSLRSTLFKVSQPLNPDGTLGDMIVFQGDGHGHGVGLCQFGAQQMARKGANYREILARYYSKCRIVSPGSNELASLP